MSQSYINILLLRRLRWTVEGTFDRLQEIVPATSTVETVNIQITVSNISNQMIYIK